MYGFVTDYVFKRHLFEKVHIWYKHTDEQGRLVLWLRFRVGNREITGSSPTRGES